MYVRFPGGRFAPSGYIVPCEPTGRTSGRQTQVILTNEEGDLSWAQWVQNEQLLTDAEVEGER